MNALTCDEASRMVQDLRSLHDEIGQFLSKCGHQPSRQSQAAAELRTYPRPESLTTAHSQGTALIEVGADQLMAFTKTVTEPVQTIAPWTCVRAVIEASALASWLLDPNIDARTRVQRSFAFRHEGLAQQAKFGRASGSETDTAQVCARLDEVEQVALGLGFPRVENQKGKRIGIAQQMPSITSIVAQTLDEEATYRLLSAMAHAHHWALQQLGFQRVEGHSIHLAETNQNGTTVRIMEKNLESISVAFLCNKAASALVKPIWRKCQLFGWDMGCLKSILDSVLGGIVVGEADCQVENAQCQFS